MSLRHVESGKGIQVQVRGVASIGSPTGMSEGLVHCSPGPASESPGSIGLPDEHAAMVLAKITAQGFCISHTSAYVASAHHSGFAPRP